MRARPTRQGPVGLAAGALMPARLSAESLAEITCRTVGHYAANAEAFWRGTRDHDVSQNIDALLAALGGAGPHRILDLGCGPGRDLCELRRRGQVPVGLDACAAFVEMARRLSGEEVLHQDLLSLDLAPRRFHGVYANASLFHVPSQEMPRVLGQLRGCLAPGGVLFVSNPRGGDSEGFQGERYGTFYEDDTWVALVTQAGFRLLDLFRRPTGLPLARQPWLATVWRSE